MGDDVEFGDFAPLFGAAATGVEPVYLEGIYPYCGHCGSSAMDMWPRQIRLGMLPEGKTMELPILCQCATCNRYVLALRRIVGNAEGRAEVATGLQVYPTRLATKTSAEQYRNWS